MGEYSFPEVNQNKTIPITKQISSQKNENEEYNFLRCNRYNLLVSSSEAAWEEDSYQLERSRCLTSYTSQTIKEAYGKLGSEQIEKIKSYPCILAYEDCVRKNAYIGYITDIGKGGE